LREKERRLLNLKYGWISLKMNWRSWIRNFLISTLIFNELYRD